VGERGDRSSIHAKKGGGNLRKETPFTRSWGGESQITLHNKGGEGKNRRLHEKRWRGTLSVRKGRGAAGRAPQEKKKQTLRKNAQKKEEKVKKGQTCAHPFEERMTPWPD